MNAEIEKFKRKVIRLEYIQPDSDFISYLKTNDSVVEVQNQIGIITDNKYFKSKIPGSLQKIYLRKALLEKIHKALALLAPHYGFVIFDGFRSKETQGGLFESYFQKISEKNQGWPPEKIHAETLKFVAHPDEEGRFEIPPHNSGGAVDLALTYNGQPVDMGTGFDDLSEKAATTYFEKSRSVSSNFTQEEWNRIRTHRRILFHAMTAVGFTNWKHEWWHFDLGNCVWAQEFQIPWIFDSMEILVGKILR